MTLHLIIQCVGIESIDHLRRSIAEEVAEARDRGARPLCRHHTRHFPRRADELLQGGSLYWIIRGRTRCRQPIKGVERIDDPESGKRCVLLFGPEIIPTVPAPHDPMQGWRYLEVKDAPADLEPLGRGSRRGARGLPPEMIAELRALGLL
jgi:hypothetical protein